MGMAAKILWGEGLFLRPQHFQRQDQYHEMRLHRTVARCIHICGAWRTWNGTSPR